MYRMTSAITPCIYGNHTQLIANPVTGVTIYNLCEMGDRHSGRLPFLSNCFGVSDIRTKLFQVYTQKEVRYNIDFHCFFKASRRSSKISEI